MEDKNRAQRCNALAHPAFAKITTIEVQVVGRGIAVFTILTKKVTTLLCVKCKSLYRPKLKLYEILRSSKMTHCLGNVP